MNTVRLYSQSYGVAHGRRYRALDYNFELSAFNGNGGAQGNIISMIYKGDHYRYIVRTEENEEDYVLSCQTKDVTAASAKLYSKVPKALVLVKKFVKFANENCPCPFVKA